MIIWNPWHGCHKISEGCQHCYMYFLDGQRGIDTSRIYRTESFHLPMARTKSGRFKIPAGSTLSVGLSTDFFLEEADEWRAEAWRIIRYRSDIIFRLLTKRAERIPNCLPADWGDGYENVMLSVTCENQCRADERLPVLLQIPARHKGFMAAPFIGPLDASRYLCDGQIEEVLCGGENYDGARPCHFAWVESLSQQCRQHNVTFNFIETGTTFIKNGHTYHIPIKRIQSEQAFKSGLSFQGKPIQYHLVPPEPTLFSGDSAFPEELQSYEPFFRKHCQTCGARLTCSGCSNCGRCHQD
ncbi:MAG: DUF5131 family protein [Alloprevotella sp.]|nr:DUF5131 family protein [Alloprevotella sp.]